MRQAREEQGLTISELSIATRIKEHYLSALEADRFQMLPSPIQQKGFVRSYAQALGLDPEKLVSRLPISREEISASEVGPSQPPPGDGEPEESAGPIGAMGETIRLQRERLGFTREDIEEQIYIPERYLTAIEEGKLDALPSTVQGRGMVKNYAEFLGLDPDPLLLQYADTLQARYRAKHPLTPKKPSRWPVPPWLRRLVSGPLPAGLIIILVVISALIWSSVLVFGDQEDEVEITATIPGVAEMLLPSNTPPATITPTPEPPSEIEVEITLTPGAAGGEDQAGQETATLNVVTAKNVRVQLIILQRSWVRVVVDGSPAFEGRLLPGSVEVFEAEQRIEVLTGNAGGVEVIFNQRDLGVMGLFGEVVSRVYTSEGIATPTPTVSITPTITQTPTPSATPSLTPPATPTAGE